MSTETAAPQPSSVRPAAAPARSGAGRPLPSARRLVPLAVLAAVLLLALTYMAVLGTPTDGTEGVRQKLTYLHPAFAIVTLIAFVAGAFFGWRHLRTGDPADDLRTYVAVHQGQVFCLIALVTGAIWGRAAWGTWFDWGEPILVSFLVIFLLYATYQPMRFAIEDPERQARSASVFAVVCGVFAPVCFGVVRMTTNILHPQPLNQPAENLPGTVGLTFGLSVVALLVLLVALWHYEVAHKGNRIRLRRLERRIEGAAAADLGSGRSSSPVTL